MRRSIFSTQRRSRNGATLAPIFVAIAVLSSIGVGGLALALWPEQPGRVQPPEPAASEVSGPSGTELSDSPRRPRTAQRFVWM